MNSKIWMIILGSTLIALSAVLYLAQIEIFHTPRDTFFYLFQDLAFVPVEVLVVTLIINRLLSIREKRSMLKKMNMVIGAFFSEVGTGLLKFFSDFDLSYEEIRENLIVTGNWPDKEFINKKKYLKNYEYKIESKKGDLESLKKFLHGKRSFSLALLENPNLLEHESFTELLWAVFHLTEELAFRDEVGRLSDADYEHLSNDIKRAYALLISEWLEYMKHLNKDYPYLFSLAVRTNPFDPEASPDIK
ncbi:MAG: hypothetical protein A2149_00385 [Candidatus Schekmanbacteria bacterium RBG_16_38_11]|uniref:Uncharacterized protein n=1 Tax=Candidatus Schekmanbacteria bacterium RBG_16_38_11 TaxID=1817880 RepID=A0A1F7S0G0_9BACT|nr:MAG: hypothetical protein A2149_00385 [Candidatus Schekmanbacteria bacterium RBG_16_38_11]